MNENSSEIRSVAWSEALPFVRLFRAVPRSLHFTRLSLGFACVIGCYLVGRLFDLIWLSAGSGVLPGSVADPRGEIGIYASADREGYRAWIEQARTSRRALEINLVARFGENMDPSKAAAALREQSAQRLLGTQAAQEENERALGWVRERTEAVLTAIRNDAQLSGDERALRRRHIQRSADALRCVLGGSGLSAFTPTELDGAGDALLSAEPALASAARVEASGLLARAVPRARGLAELRAQAPRGVWISLLEYQMNCFAAAVRGVAGPRWGWGGGAFDPQPSLLGALGSCASGVLWVFTERPWFAALCGLVHALLFAFFGSAICRSTALQSARPDALSPGLFAFARQKVLLAAGALVAPGLLILGIAAVMFVGAVVAALPGIGPILGGLLFVLQLLGGFALVMVLAAWLLGAHLFVPTIAVEGSDAFDALQHGAGYVVQRPWHVGFYSLLLLLGGGMAFVVLRALVLGMLKLTHVVMWAGMSWFGSWSSARTDSFSRLDAIWSMPAWSELSLLPTVGGMAFWGAFADAPLSWSESIASVLMAAWVFLFVALLGGFVVSYYFCASTEMYFLLRRSVDGMDYDEIYYEEDEEAFFAERDEQSAGGAAPSGVGPAGDAPRGTPLPVVGSGPAPQ